MPEDKSAMERLAMLRHEFGRYYGVNKPLEASTTFAVTDAQTLPEMFAGLKGVRTGCYVYGRCSNPTVWKLGKRLAAIEGTESAYCTASGMAAISGALFQLCDSGDSIVAANTIYGGSFALLHDFLPKKANIHTHFVDITDLAAVEAAIDEKTKVIYAETIANPTLRVADIKALARLAHANGAKLVIDNTFAPLLVQPKALGADVVIHSLTKFINGASDVIAGVICADMAFIEGLMDMLAGPCMLLGPTLDPIAAAKIDLRIPHLELRLKEHARRAALFAQRLQAAGVRVIYPGLLEHPDHALLKRHRQAEYGYGGLLTLDLQSAEKADALMETLQNKQGFGFIAVSLGFFDTLMSPPASSTSSEMSDEDLQKAGIGPGLVRMSPGYTGSVEQRWSQLEAGLAEAGIIGTAAIAPA